jgi:NAD(P)-dependent dehydrogenase (short-subunit alcohol dehydrogenase family)
MMSSAQPYKKEDLMKRLEGYEAVVTGGTRGIRKAICEPGYIWTPLVEAIADESPEGVEQFRKNLDALHPIGHVGEPMDIAYGALYLASAESTFVTGSELVIDGGYTAQ